MRHTFIPFHSADDFSLKGKYPQNFNFELDLWLPDSNEPCKDLVIIIHGFLEGIKVDSNKPEKAKWRYSQYAEELTSAGKAVVLLPLPFHFQRGDNSNAVPMPLERLRINGTYLYYGGYTQVVRDVLDLVKIVNEKATQFGCSTDPNIHLIGYSIGGVGALGAAMEIEKSTSLKSITSLSILLSSWRLDSINSEVLEQMFGPHFGLTSSDWEKVRVDLSKARSEGQLDNIFQTLFWGGSGNVIDVSVLASRVLFVHGIKDEVFQISSTEALRTDLLKPNCTLITLPSNHIALRENKKVAQYLKVFISTN